MFARGGGGGLYDTEAPPRGGRWLRPRIPLTPEEEGGGGGRHWQEGGRGGGDRPGRLEPNSGENRPQAQHSGERVRTHTRTHRPFFRFGLKAGLASGESQLQNVVEAVVL